MLELEYKRLITGALQTMGWLTQEHEDKVELYIPDLSYSGHGVMGWIEVKYVEKMKAAGLSTIPHYTKGQECWLIDRARAGGGRCFLLLGTGAGHYMWSASSLRNARAGTYIAALSLCCCRSERPGDQVAEMAAEMTKVMKK